ncbi:molybdopterin-synthase adenylyltransferase MoeB [Sulfuriroseicoccus oceanibius]|uniref:Molybdopterin-synthase adenylyltransferase n=1 Tax=Sulfuriroseicoccus oceanibius TaxID=2707525 RepID=A0A6B3L4G9_9BACT|nr:molybdopterin-synthase adenylyltransferase MoeB [Sulfuriroseicoccus oceanibius]QQL45038.1 molybdopterin-synthase adenylyltransferase MoeB [Sulfuriroseicoccus oceanibius]
MDHTLNRDELDRYARHLTLPGFGTDGQQRLKNGAVLCIGTGGLGSPAAMYLAAAGVGRVGLVDADVVERSNLQRQIIHGESGVGRSKLASAVERLKEINPNVQVDVHEVRFTAANAKEIAADYDVILDGTDNFPTRFLSNDVAVLLKKPNVYGSILLFEGQVSVFAPHLGGPCYRCLFPEPPAPDAVPSCAEAGVIGALPGVIGSMQAMEAVKLLAGVGEPPLGKLVHYDALTTSFRSFAVRRDPQCKLCGDHPTQTGLVDYEGFCGLPGDSGMPEFAAEGVRNISVTGLWDVIRNGVPAGAVVLDVREEKEFASGRAPGSRLEALSTLKQRFDAVCAECEGLDSVYVICKAGGRSLRACKALRDAGVKNLINVAGGMDAWKAAGLEME